MKPYSRVVVQCSLYDYTTLRLHNYLPMEKELSDRLDQIEFVLQRTEQKVKRIYSIFMWTAIASIVVIVLPLIGLAFVLPKFIGTFSSAISQISDLSGMSF